MVPGDFRVAAERHSSIGDSQADVLRRPLLEAGDYPITRPLRARSAVTGAAPQWPPNTRNGSGKVGRPSADSQQALQLLRKAAAVQQWTSVEGTGRGARQKETAPRARFSLGRRFAD